MGQRPYSAKGQGGFGKGDVVVWSGSGGAFVGASVSGSDFTSNSAEDASFYGKQVSTKQITNGDVHNPQARKLVDTLPA
jgi:lipid-binding SYLF domain-containing protein